MAERSRGGWFDRKKQRCVEGIPVLLQMGEMGDGVRQHFASGSDAQLGLREKFVA